MKLGRPPKILENLYADLRDRHLLIPIAALIAAMIAVPFLLKTQPGPAPAAVPPASSETSSIEPAVLAAQEVGVRDYRKRLADLKSKNPFEQQFVPKESSADATSTSGTSPTAASPDTSTGTGAVPAGDSVTMAPTPTEPGTSTTPTGTGSGNGGGPSNPSPRDTRVVHELFTRHINVLAGVQGDTKLHQDVKPMTILPDKLTPVVAFLGTDEGGKRAAFVVSSDVTSVGGDGACVPGPSNCLYITLQKGEKATLDYAPDGQTYELKLLAIRNVKLKSD
jgi:hypothetical protein